MADSISLTVNGTKHEISADPQMPLLWVVRDLLQMPGTKFGCGVALCGACSLYVNGELVRSCGLALSDAADAEITTIEGLSKDGTHPVQLAWIEEQVPQCGYCQSGMIMAAAKLLEENPHPTDADIDAAITNICRCGTYPRIRQGIHNAAKRLAAGGQKRKG
ncbi:(2Fe-2S)-binding protein [Govanella unica]|uniref:(2Fe-2S)-binding protein n=1 Tax=Govanella unica TaxID=2975056 RepID=A0A9X3TWA5_9PROT|nr:(2Fe-2S)-binding protein [Govania unica]MDA5192911.1 (2Fe-2S)-binding protein [Govania unica]